MIVGMLRIRNEARWIEKCLKSIQGICDLAIVMDDHSTDDTVKICTSFNFVAVKPSPFHDLNETRDKNWLLESVKETNPDWVLSIDGDEALDPGSQIVVKQTLQNSLQQCYSLRVRYLWNEEHLVRVDGVYNKFRRPSLFRYSPGQLFQSTNAGGNFHCGNVPLSLLHYSVPLDASLLHYGYMYKEDRLRKFEWYNKIDPANLNEDCYRHMVIGDLFPEDSRFRYGGPLELMEIENVL